MSMKRSQQRSLRMSLNALFRDRGGNALALTAAALFPCIAVVGSAVDISRYYIMQSRLQNACDSAVLAGRKSMTGLAWESKDEDVARNFFNFNFPAGMMGANTPVITFETTADGQVNAAATVVAPTVLMSLFGFEDKPLDASCTAELQLPNTDVVFALDTTLSMNETNPGDSQNRIAGLRSAVSNFHGALARAATSGAQIRYGFVPFSSTVNVGHFLRREWMVDDWTYQSRIPDGTEQRTVPGGTSTAWHEQWGPASNNPTTHDTWGSPESCTAPANTYRATWVLISRSTDANGNVTEVHERTEQGSTFNASIVNGQCRIRETRYNNRVQRRTRTSYIRQTDSTTVTDYWWQYRPVSYDVRPLKGSNPNGLMAGGTITARIGNNHGNVTTTWGGCIEERDTVRDASYAPIPAAAFDLDVDLVPSTGTTPEAIRTQWRPFMPQLVFVRRSTTNWSMANVRDRGNFTRGDGIQASLGSVCPSRAQKLKPMTASEITTYMNGLQTAGWTYLDIGMLWAGRLISPTGLFRDENSNAANGGSISRHLIFMTDGEIQTFIRNYDAYGLSALDRRRTSASSLPTDARQNQIVSDRFDALCSTIKSKGITIWTVAFGTTLTTQLRSCASGNDRAFSAQNAAQLNEAFEDIASKIAQLRLTG